VTSITISRQYFPSDFVFGAATAAYQIEGHAFGGAGMTHWDSFAATPGNVVGGENGSVACDHYHRFEADLDLLAEGNFDAYRFSTSWARVIPEGRGAVNPAGLDYYDRLVDAMLERGIRPFQTLYHWELPSAITDLGGWANRDTAKWFGDFAEVISQRIGDRVEAVATINEPWCVSYLSHFVGAHAPGLRDVRATARAMHHVLLGHAEAMERLRAMGMQDIGIVMNFAPVQPVDRDDQTAAATFDAILNRWFIEAISHGTYPEPALAGLAPYLPKGWEDDMSRISQPIDWLGINYYTRHLVQHRDGPWPNFAEVPGPLPKTQMGWEIYPEGLHQTLMRLVRENVYNLPLLITENGTSLDDRVENGAVGDRDRIAFLDAHLKMVRRAMDDGANVTGYFCWSLMDNFEWAEGYAKRFGLIHVDFETQRRTPKASYHALKAALARTGHP